MIITPFSKDGVGVINQSVVLEQSVYSILEQSVYNSKPIVTNDVQKLAVSLVEDGLG